MQYGSILCRVFVGTQCLAELNDTGRDMLCATRQRAAAQQAGCDEGIRNPRR